MRDALSIILFFCTLQLAMGEVALAGDAADVFRQDFERVKKDVELSCNNEHQSEGREVNASRSLQRVDIFWNKVKARMQVVHSFLDQPEKPLKAQLQRDLASLKSDRRVVLRSLEKSPEDEKNQKVRSELDQKIEFLDGLDQSMQARQANVSNGLAGQWINTEVSRAQSELADLSALSEDYQVVKNRAKTCKVTATTLSENGTSPHWKLGTAYADAPENSPQGEGVIPPVSLGADSSSKNSQRSSSAQSAMGPSGSHPAR